MIRRGPKLEGCALPTLEIRVELKEKRVKKREKYGCKKKKINAAATGNQIRDPSITDQMSVLTNQIHLKIQFSHRFDQKALILFHSKLFEFLRQKWSDYNDYFLLLENDTFCSDFQPLYFFLWYNRLSEG